MALGIDLGTTNSVVAVMEGGEPTVIASAEGGLTCDMSKDIFCRKPELQLEYRGPATKYAGTGSFFST